MYIQDQVRESKCTVGLQFSCLKLLCLITTRINFDIITYLQNLMFGDE